MRSCSAVSLCKMLDVLGMHPKAQLQHAYARVVATGAGWSRCLPRNDRRECARTQHPWCRQNHSACLAHVKLKWPMFWGQPNQLPCEHTSTRSVYLTQPFPAPASKFALRLVANPHLRLSNWPAGWTRSLSTSRCDAVGVLARVPELRGARVGFVENPDFPQAPLLVLCLSSFQSRTRRLTADLWHAGARLLLSRCDGMNVLLLWVHCDAVKVSWFLKLHFSEESGQRSVVRLLQTTTRRAARGDSGSRPWAPLWRAQFLPKALANDVCSLTRALPLPLWPQT